MVTHKSVILKYMVGIYKCDNYEDNNLDVIIEKIFKQLDFENQIQTGMNVVLKPNLLALRDEKNVTTTNHSFVKAVAKKVIGLGAKVTIYDSPAGKFEQSTLERMYDKLGFREIEEIGAVLNIDTTSKNQEINGKLLKNVHISNVVTNADLVINLPKLKTHAMMNLTCAVKNMFGIVPGMKKAEQHAIYPDYNDFANSMIDLSLCVKNQITIVDAIWSMEGTGPNLGIPRHTGLVIASKNQFEVDFVAMKLINLNLEYAYTVKQSLERKLFNIKEVDIVNENLDKLIMKDFKMPSSLRKNIFKGTIFVSKFAKPYPVFNKNKCTKCKLCINRCPKNVLEIKNDRVVLKSKKDCIRCFCCSEHCPSNAIDIKHMFIFSGKN